MRLITPILLLLLLALQYRIWLGHNSRADHARLSQAVTEQHAANLKLKRRNSLLAKEIQDLKSGQDAVEERARNELGMIRKGEVFYRLHQPVENHYHD